jgi:hypothetical protein
METHGSRAKTEFGQWDNGDHPERKEVEGFRISILVLHQVACDLS